MHVFFMPFYVLKVFLQKLKGFIIDEVTNHAVDIMPAEKHRERKGSKPSKKF